MRFWHFLAVSITIVPASPQTLPFTITPIVAEAQTEANAFGPEQLDALLAPIALYPDELLSQVLMASTFPLEIVQASRWLAEGANSKLQGDALAKALEAQSWDPSVKSLVPFPQVLEMMNGKLDWTQQVGYAFANQQADVMNSIQRLRAQAQQAGSLKSTPQQTVSAESGSIIIQPASPQTVYVPVYNPSVVYGAWPYPSYPPVYFPPPAYLGGAFVSGLAFATGVAVVGSLWGWSRPAWGAGNVNVNVNRWNNINVNRTGIQSSTWRAPRGGTGGLSSRPPRGPVGAPARANGLPANAIGRSSVKLDASLVNRPRPGGGPGGGQAAISRPGGAGGAASGGQLGGSRAGGAGVGQRPSASPPRPTARPATRPPSGGGAFGGISQGSRAAQYGARGAQSRSFSGGGGAAARPRAGGGRRGR